MTQEELWSCWQHVQINFQSSLIFVFHYKSFNNEYCISHVVGIVIDVVWHDVGVHEITSY